MMDGWMDGWKASDEHQSRGDIVVRSKEMVMTHIDHNIVELSPDRPMHTSVVV